MKIHLKLSFLDVVPSTYKLSKYIFFFLFKQVLRTVYCNYYNLIITKFINQRIIYK